MLTKYARLENTAILDVKGSRERRSATLDKLSEFNDFRTEDGYLYARIRAISSRVNKNNDGWPSIELAGGEDIFNRHRQASADTAFTVLSHDGNPEYGFATFDGKPIFVDHHNSDHKRARGVIVDAKLHVEDYRTASELDPYYATAPDEHKPPTWVELLLEVDAKAFPKLAAALLEGSKDPSKGIDGFSMGCDVEKSVCSICKHTATSPEEYCNHVKLKGMKFTEVGEDGKKFTKKAYEDCYGIKFFEISAVFDPADETALVREVTSSSEEVAADPHAQGEIANRVVRNAEAAIRKGFYTVDAATKAIVGDLTGAGVPKDFAWDIAKGFQKRWNQHVDQSAPDTVPEHWSKRGAAATVPTGAGMPPTYDSFQNAPADEGPECPVCGDRLERDPYYGGATCQNCGYSEEGQQDEWGQSYSKTADNPPPQTDLVKAPESVDTLREEKVCPVCGSDMDEPTCDICGYVEPPDGLNNPDLQQAQQRDQEGVQQNFAPQGEQPGMEPPLGGPSDDGGVPGGNATNLASTQAVTNDMDWSANVHPRTARRINDAERPLIPNNETVSDEPKETIVKDQETPVTSRTAKETNNMSNRTAAEAQGQGVKEYKRVDVTGVGGVDKANNEEASRADAQVDVTGIGSTGEDDVAADQEGVKVGQGDEHTKNIEGTPTDTWSGTEDQHAPVTNEVFPKDSAKQGVKPIDKSVQPQERVNLEDSNYNPPLQNVADQWTGTDGNGVTRQQDPVTTEDNPWIDVKKSRSLLFTAFKLADTEIELGITQPDKKYDRVSELESEDQATLDARLDTLSRVRTAGLKKKPNATQEPGRLPSMRQASTQDKAVDEEFLDAAFFGLSR